MSEYFKRLKKDILVEISEASDLENDHIKIFSDIVKIIDFIDKSKLHPKTYKLIREVIFDLIQIDQELLEVTETNSPQRNREYTIVLYQLLKDEFSIFVNEKGGLLNLAPKINNMVLSILTRLSEITDPQKFPELKNIGELKTMPWPNKN